MLLGKEQGITGHAPAHVRKIAEQHLNAYVPGDIDILMRSVSPNGGLWAGMAPPDGAVVIRTPEEIRTTYTALLGAVKLFPPQFHLAICTDWYAFFETTSKFVDKASGQQLEGRAISLFGNDQHATAIDMSWPFTPDLGLDTPETAVQNAIARSTSHRRRMAGWLAGDVAQATFGISPKALMFMPAFDPEDPKLVSFVKGIDGYRDYLQALFDAYKVEEMKLSNEMIGNPYAFSDHAVSFSPRRKGTPFRANFVLADVFGGDGLVAGILGCATRA